MGGGADILSAIRSPLVLPLAKMDSIIMAQSDQHRHSLFIIPPDTIVAISSSVPSPSAGNTSGSKILAKRDLPRAIIRMSGSLSISLASQVFHCGALEDSLASATWKRICGEVRWRDHVLPAHAYVMRAPLTYTREDIVEIHLPALPWVISSILERLMLSGARLAQPGEFTRRAFENGRINLGQAVAVGALLQTSSADEARQYAARISGDLSAQRRKLKSETEELLSLVELGLDFSHEDVGVLSVPEMIVRIECLRQQAQQICEVTGIHSQHSGRSESGSLNSAFPRIVLAGPTNAGKSSLFNRLLGRNASIVSAERHTTRDIVEAPLHLSPPTCNTVIGILVDTAGVGTQAEIESVESIVAEGSTRGRRTADKMSAPPSISQHGLSSPLLMAQASWNMMLGSIQSADVLLLVLDGSLAPEVYDNLFLRDALLGARPAVAAIVWTKADLIPANEALHPSLAHLLPEGESKGCMAANVPRASRPLVGTRQTFERTGGRDARGTNEFRNYDHTPESNSSLPFQFHPHHFQVSSTDGRGIPELLEFLKVQITALGTRSQESHITAMAHERNADHLASTALERAVEALTAGHGEDIAAVELRETIHALWLAEGSVLRHDALTESMLDRIFSGFCIGK